MPFLNKVVNCLKWAEANFEGIWKEEELKEVKTLSKELPKPLPKGRPLS